MLRATPWNPPGALSWGAGSGTGCPQRRAPRWLCGTGAPALGSGGRRLPRCPGAGRGRAGQGTARAPTALWVLPFPRQDPAPAPRTRLAAGDSLSSSARFWRFPRHRPEPRPLRESLGGGPSAGPPAQRGPQEEKQSPQHSMQISRQSADSQQASMMPQSMSQGRSQSAHSPELQQQQQMQESSEVQEPQVAQSSTMLQSVRNSQKRQERMQWTQQSGEGRGGETAPGTGGCWGSAARVGILPQESVEGMGKGVGRQALPQGSPSTPRPQERPILADRRRPRSTPALQRLPGGPRGPAGLGGGDPKG